MVDKAKNEPAATAAESGSVSRRLALGAFWALVGAIVSRGLTLASSVAAGRILGTTGFGELGMIQSTQGLFGILAGAGMGLATTKFVAEYRTNDHPKAGRCIGFALFVAVVSAALLAPLLFVFAGLISERVLHAPHLESEFQVSTGLIFFGTINGVQTGGIVGMGNFRTVAILNIVRGAALCVLLVLGIMLWGVMGGVIGLVLTEVVAVLANQSALMHLFPHLRPRWPKSDEARLELITICRFSLLALSGSACTTLVLWFANVLLVSEPEGYAALGLFNAADRWRQLLLFLPASISPLMLSMLSNLHGRNDPAEYRRLVSLNLWINFGVVMVPSAIVALGAPWGMLVFGEEYRAGWMTLAVLAVSSVAVAMNNVLGQILVSKGGIWSRFLLDVFLSAVLALTSWFLIPQLRDLGMAVSSLIAYGATALVLSWPVVRCMRAT
jgi:O-antigen/teichoic acid export membrane protein